MCKADLNRLALAILMASLPGLLAPAPGSANDINIIRSGVEHSFAQHVTFKLEATSDDVMTEAYLFFRATYADEAEKAKVQLDEPSREISLRYVRDVQLYPLPPFADIVYWWQLEYADGTQVRTEPGRFTYTDNRFKWEQLKGASVTIHWVEGHGDPALTQAALDVAEASVKDIQAELRAAPPDRVDVYIYDSKRNLEAAMVLAGREWVGGQARPEPGVVVMTAPAEQGYTSRMKRYLPHEITHLMLYELTTPEGYPHVPHWLNEGLATANEGLPTPEYALALKEAIDAGRLLSLQELCVPFSPDPRTALLSYAESESFVTFVRERYGADGIRNLLSAYADGASCSSGVEQALGVSLARLESNWRLSLEPRSGWRVVVDRVGVWVGLWLLGLILVVPMIGGIRRQRQS